MGYFWKHSISSSADAVWKSIWSPADIPMSKSSELCQQWSISPYCTIKRKPDKHLLAAPQSREGLISPRCRIPIKTLKRFKPSIPSRSLMQWKVSLFLPLKAFSSHSHNPHQVEWFLPFSLFLWLASQSWRKISLLSDELLIKFQAEALHLLIYLAFIHPQELLQFCNPASGSFRVQLSLEQLKVKINPCGRLKYTTGKRILCLEMTLLGCLSVLL